MTPQIRGKCNAKYPQETALSKNKAAMLEKRLMPTRGCSLAEEAVKDPFVLEFLDLKDEYSESDLEKALISQLADFLLELGDDLAFLGRQRRLRVDDTWFRIDLIFSISNTRGWAKHAM